MIFIILGRIFGMNPLQAQAIKYGYKYSSIDLIRSSVSGKWLNPYTRKICSVEEAALGYFHSRGWRWFHREGGLLLNLIKAASFKKIPDCYLSVYVEAIYAHNIANKEYIYSIRDLLSNIENTNIHIIVNNYNRMERKIDRYFPGLKEYMIVELYNILGNEKLNMIAKKFSENPYEYRKGWPDLTIWRDNFLRFIEIKTSNDRLHESQKVIAREFGLPLSLDFGLIEVKENFQALRIKRG